MTSEQIDAIANDSYIAKTLLRRLLLISSNVEELESLAKEDVKFARFCDRCKIWTRATNWSEMTVR